MQLNMKTILLLLVKNPL